MIQEGRMTLQKFLEEIAETAKRRAEEKFIQFDEERLGRMRTDFRSEFLAPSKRKLREMLQVRAEVKPGELVDIVCEEINSRGLPLVKYGGQMVMTQRGPVASPMPISLEPEKVDREGGLRELAEVFHDAIISLALGGLIYSNLPRDIDIIEGIENTAKSADQPELSSVDESKLREDLKASIIDVRAFIAEFRKRVSTGQYL